MGFDVALFIAILALAFFLFSREIYPLEFSALLIVSLLILAGFVAPATAFQNFGSPAVILIGSLFVLTTALQTTGVLNKLETNLLRVAKISRTLTFVVILALTACFSAFVSNTATLAVSIPLVVAVAREFGESPRVWLMPLAFASVLGGMNTLIGTSTNIIISSLLPAYGLPSFSLFFPAPVTIPILLIGLIYLTLFSRRFLPVPKDGDQESVELRYNMRSYTSELRILEGSRLCNQSIASTELFREAGITVLGVIRGQQPLLLPRGSLVLLEDDRLIIEGKVDLLGKLLQKYNLEFHEQIEIDTDSDIALHEVLVSGRSLLNGRTPAEVFLRNRYRISLIAIDRQGVQFREKLSNIRIVAGDILLVQFLGRAENSTLDYLGLIPLKEFKQETPREKYAPLAMGLFAAALIFGSITHYPLAFTALLAATLLVIFRILRPDEVYQAIEWKILIFIASVLALGQGMETSGTAAFVSQILYSVFENYSPLFSLGFFFGLTLVLTQLLSNQATAVVMIPVAINSAQALGLDPMPFILSVTVAASCCFITPFEPAVMLVYGPGRYKFSDFFRLGSLLAVMAFAMGVFLIAWRYGLL